MNLSPRKKSRNLASPTRCGAITGTGQPAAAGRQLAGNRSPPAASHSRPPVSSSFPAVSCSFPAVSRSLPAVRRSLPAVSCSFPANNRSPPAVSRSRPAPLVRQAPVLLPRAGRPGKEIIRQPRLTRLAPPPAREGLAFFALCTSHFALCTSHFALRTFHFSLCTFHFALGTAVPHSGQRPETLPV